MTHRVGHQAPPPSQARTEQILRECLTVFWSSGVETQGRRENLSSKESQSAETRLRQGQTPLQSCGDIVLRRVQSSCEYLPLGGRSQCLPGEDCFHDGLDGKINGPGYNRRYECDRARTAARDNLSPAGPRTTPRQLTTPSNTPSGTSL